MRLYADKKPKRRGNHRSEHRSEHGSKHRSKKNLRRLAQPTLLLPLLPLPQLVRWGLVFVMLLGSIVISGLSVVGSADDMRRLYQQLGATQEQQDQLLAEHSRLLLERGALSSLHNIEQVAETELRMEFPEVVGQVLQ